MRTSIIDYKVLIRSFVSSEISAIRFEAEYLKLFKRDDSLDEEAYKILSPLFWAVEDFCSFPELREEDDIDEQQLFEQAVTALEKLEQFGSLPRSCVEMQAGAASRSKAQEHPHTLSHAGAS